MLFTFPSRYWFTIGLSGVFSLGGWCRRIQAGFLRSRPTQDSTTANQLALTGLSPAPACLPRQLSFVHWSDGVVLQPQPCRDSAGLGSCAFARHYLRNHCYFLFLRVLRCFSSPGSPTRRCSASSMHWVAPFGHPRIKSYVPIPADFRSLSRPSSPLRA